MSRPDYDPDATPYEPFAPSGHAKGYQTGVEDGAETIRDYIEQMQALGSPAEQILAMVELLHHYELAHIYERRTQ